MPSGQLSPTHSAATTSQAHHQQQHMRSTSQQPTQQSLGYSTTGRMSVHQQQASASTHQQHNQQGPVSFTRALEMTENIAKDGQQIQTHPGSQNQNTTQVQGGGGVDNTAQDNQKRDSVYDVNNYEISV